jgi:hypothetical protein
MNHNAHMCLTKRELIRLMVVFTVVHAASLLLVLWILFRFLL